MQDLRHVFLYGRRDSSFAQLVDEVVVHGRNGTELLASAGRLGLLPTTWSRAPASFVLIQLFPFLGLRDRLLLEEISPAWRAACWSTGWEDLPGAVVCQSLAATLSRGRRSLSRLREADVMGDAVGDTLPGDEPRRDFPPPRGWWSLLARMHGLRHFSWAGPVTWQTSAHFEELAIDVFDASSFESMPNLRSLEFHLETVESTDDPTHKDSTVRPANFGEAFAALGGITGPLERLVLDASGGFFVAGFLAQAVRHVSRSEAARSNLTTLTLCKGCYGADRMEEADWLPLKELGALRTLHLDDLGDRLFDSEGALSSLRGLGLVANQLVDLKLAPAWRISSFEPIGQLVNLTNLEFEFEGRAEDFGDENSPERQLRFLSGLTQLRRLKVGGGDSIAALATLTRMTDLDYYGKMDHVEAGRVLDCMPLLERLALWDVHDEDEPALENACLLGAMSQLRGLTQLTLSLRSRTRPCSYADLRGLASLPRLSRLVVGGSIWSAAESFAALGALLAEGRFPAVEHLELRSESVSPQRHAFDQGVDGNDCSVPQNLLAEIIRRRNLQ